MNARLRIFHDAINIITGVFDMNADTALEQIHDALERLSRYEIDLTVATYRIGASS